MYSPRIPEDLIPSLYWTARERATPMTRLVELYVCRGLAMEALGERAASFLPARVHSLRAREADQLVDRVEAFYGLKEMDQWHAEALRGVGRAQATALLSLRGAGTGRGPGEHDIIWKYETAALNLRTVYAQTLGHLTALGLRVG